MLEDKVSGRDENDEAREAGGKYPKREREEKVREQKSGELEEKW